MTDDAHQPDWDDDEIVPLGDLRPSRKYFGPLPADAPKGQQPQRPPRPPQRQPQQGGLPPRRPRPPEGRSGQPARPDQLRERPPRPPDRASRGERPAARERDVDPRDGRPVSPARGQQPQAKRQRPDTYFAEPSTQQVRMPRLDRQPQPRERRPEPRRETADRRIVGAEAADPILAPITDGTVAVFSRKGGVGKTTISAYLGLTLAAERGGRILAIDGDSEAGSLGWLMAPKAPATLAALSTAQPVPASYRELRGYTAATEGGLDIIVGDTDGREVVDQRGLERALVEVARNYDVSIFDTGGGVSISAGRVLVRQAKVMLLVMGPSVDSIRAAERTLAWVEERPGEAVDPDVKIIAVINGIPNSVKEAHIARIEEHFAERCAAVVRIPWDDHLADGTTKVGLDTLNKGTRRAFSQLAATTVTTMASQNPRHAQRGGRRAS